jgi:valyl-tRNA synthetase
MNVPAGAKIPLLIKGASQGTQERLKRHLNVISRLARLGSARETTEIPDGSVQVVLDEATLVMPLADVIDLKQERQRLEKEIKKVLGEIKKTDAKLGNDKFMSRAPEYVVEEQRERRAEAEAVLDKLKQALERL